MPTYEFTCEDCGSTTNDFYKIADRPDCITCACGGKANFRISAPNLMSVALPDGTKRRGWEQLKEASKINKQMAREKPDRRKEMAGEIKKLGYSFDGGKK